MAHPTRRASNPAREANVTAVVARALRDPAGPPPEWSSAGVGAVIASASRHRILLLLGWMLRAAGRLDEWPDEFIDVFHRAERRALSIDCVRHAELASVLSELRDAGVRALVFKGAAVAHTHYPAPHVRVRADTDLLVPEDEVRALEAVLGP